MLSTRFRRTRALRANTREKKGLSSFKGKAEFLFCAGKFLWVGVCVAPITCHGLQ